MTIDAAPPRMVCDLCHRPMRRSRDRAGDYPGTVAAHTTTCCQSCRRRGGPPQQPRDIRPPEELIEDISWIIGTDHPDSIARRVGYDNPRSLARYLTRIGRPDLARYFQRKDKP